MEKERYETPEMEIVSLEEEILLSGDIDIIDNDVDSIVP